MNLILWPYRWLAVAALAVALVGFGWIKGASHVQAQWDAAVQQQALQTAAARERHAQATVKVVTQYVDRVRVIREKGDTIFKEVPVYVPVQADAACTINRGFVRLHDAAAAGDLPEPARDADAAAAGIALSAVAGTLAANYQTCHENAEQLRALQAWVSEMASTTNFATSDRSIPNALGFQPEQRVHDIRTHHGALTMSNRFKHAVIDDVTSRNIDAGLQDNLLDLFESAMKSVATTLVREAKFDTTDFATAKGRGCEGFTLLVSRTRADSRDGWFGAFQRGDERLDVIGHLE